MTTNQRKTRLAVALLCAVAAVLAALILWRQPGSAPAGETSEHAGHADSHGHDDRHPEPAAPHTEQEGAIAMTAAQVKENGIAVDTTRPATIRETLHLPAQIKVNAERAVALAFPAQGIVRSVLVSPGDAVRAGQGLVVLQSPDVAQWRADYGTARQRVALARSVAERERKLWDEKISARQDLDAADAALAEARIGEQAARQRLAALGIAAEGEALATATLRAPQDGIVIERPAVPGMAIDPTRPLVALADLAHVWVEAAIPSDSLAQVTTGMPASVSAATLAQAQTGTVSFVGPVLGEATRMAVARVTLPNSGLRLRPGMLATVDLLGQPAHAPVTVASDAVQTIHERSVVFVRTAGGFAARTVVTGRSDGRRTEIVRGLAAGTPYAAAGSYLLKADLGKAEASHDD
ncbi:cobalt-zinc-cadmium efflux system membrane fusion protein [Pseudoduganella flava]|uniref:Cobalt-zinc-cadmium efflux system membrane fusion protein n=1 Tax=Pseudoduganella flava TaxID=871742 RepID=A0A562PAD9_9BURK|nr:efflux RND transporter periplasmic adaptor subunit [Pseudoduganella flava]QGZ38031.1 efflux RND transporter periplasmic adaptor subunit [Pseudoduganella flava]TWI40966.1 cobalt-zinc-cadmium efflux system membrane fusion protein [Pseudoduganella flava]